MVSVRHQMLFTLICLVAFSSRRHCLVAPVLRLKRSGRSRCQARIRNFRRHVRFRTKCVRWEIRVGGHQAHHYRWQTLAMKDLS